MWRRRARSHGDHAVLPGLLAALDLCRRVDMDGQRDGLIREAVDCVEAIEREIKRCRS